MIPEISSSQLSNQAMRNYFNTKETLAAKRERARIKATKRRLGRHLANQKSSRAYFKSVEGQAKLDKIRVQMIVSERFSL